MRTSPFRHALALLAAALVAGPALAEEKSACQYVQLAKVPLHYTGLSVPEKEMRFYEPVDCDKAWLAYWDRDAVVIPFERNDVGEFAIDSRAAQRIGAAAAGAAPVACDAENS
ncbi:hypothetical protein ACI48D_15610 [Massilia sp. LXY-6]|uniref:hypothetical protein n=1 Tax=Massilia sp. LXY-6 TaxID=3379823 RepID=UPI003EE3648D